MLVAMAARFDCLIPSWREFAISLGILAVMMRVLVAPGFMPDLNAAAEGEFKLVICSAGGLKPVADDMDRDTPDDGHGLSADLCPFAASSQVAIIGDQVRVANERIVPALGRLPNHGAITEPAARIPEARAPPNFS